MQQPCGVRTGLPCRWRLPAPSQRVTAAVALPVPRCPRLSPPFVALAVWPGSRWCCVRCLDRRLRARMRPAPLPRRHQDRAPHRPSLPGHGPARAGGAGCSAVPPPCSRHCPGGPPGGVFRACSRGRRGCAAWQLADPSGADGVIERRVTRSPGNKYAARNILVNKLKNCKALKDFHAC